MEDFNGTYGPGEGLPVGDVWIDASAENDTDAQRKQYGYRLYRERLYGLARTQRPLFQYGALADPVMMVMLNHFYDMEIKKPSKINEFDLGLSLSKAFFSDYEIKG